MTLGIDGEFPDDENLQLPDDVDPTDLLPRGYLSIGQSGAFLKCPYRYFLQYIEGRPTKKAARMFQGTSVHYGAEHVLTVKMQTGKLPKYQDALDAFSTGFEAEKDTVEDWEGDDPGKVKDLGAKLMGVFYKEVAPQIAPLAVEKQFCKVVKSRDSKVHLPVLGRIDTIDALLDRPEEFDPSAAAHLPSHLRRIRDLKIVTNKFPEGKVINSLQFVAYAAVEGIPNVRADQLVKGRAQVPRPRYEQQDAVITSVETNHAFEVLQGVATSISLGHFPKTDPGNWWCSEKWCGVWQHCRGKNSKH